MSDNVIHEGENIIHYSKDTVCADQFDHWVTDRALGDPAGIRLEVPKVANMALIIRGCAMSLGERVDYIEKQSIRSAFKIRLASGQSRIIMPTRKGLTHSEVQRSCNHWYYHRTGGHACLALRMGHCL